MNIITSIKKGRDRHWRNFIDRDYLGSHNLEINEDMVLTIKKVEPEEQVANHTNNTKENKMVLYFVENVPKMIINITNANSISDLYGTHIEDWEGKRIQIMRASVRAFGKTQDALRIRDIIPKGILTEAEIETKLKNCKTITDLKAEWESMPIGFSKNKKLVALKNNLKTKL